MTRNVLIIDGDPVFCQLTIQLLEPLELNVFSTHLGQAGFSMAEEVVPDLVILSAELEDMSGYRVCKQLRSSTTASGIKIIIVSSVAKDVDFEKHKKLVKSRADLYLRKPISNRSLLESVGDLLDLNLHPQVFDDRSMDPSLDFLNASDSVKNKKDETEKSDTQVQVESLEQHNLYLKKELDAFKEGTKSLEKELAATKKKLEEQSGRKRIHATA